MCVWLLFLTKAGISEWEQSEGEIVCVVIAQKGSTCAMGTCELITEITCGGVGAISVGIVINSAP